MKNLFSSQLIVNWRIYFRINPMIAFLFLMLFHINLTAQTYTEPFWNQKLPINTRIKDLMSRLTVDEKITMLIETSPGVSPSGCSEIFYGKRIASWSGSSRKIHCISTSYWLGCHLEYRFNVSGFPLRYQTKLADAGTNLNKASFKKNIIAIYWFSGRPDINLARDPALGTYPGNLWRRPISFSPVCSSFCKRFARERPPTT